MLFLSLFVIGLFIIIIGIITSMGCGVFWKTSHMGKAINMVIGGSLISLLTIIPMLSFLIELRKLATWPGN